MSGPYCWNSLRAVLTQMILWLARAWSVPSCNPAASVAARKAWDSASCPTSLARSFAPGCGSLLLRRGSSLACKRQTAAPAPARLFLPQAAPRLRSQPVILVFIFVEGDETHHALDDTSAQGIRVAAPLALSRFLRRGSSPACKNRSAAPDTARLFRPLDAAGHVCHASVMARRPSV